MSACVLFSSSSSQHYSSVSTTVPAAPRLDAPCQRWVLRNRPHRGIFLTLGNMPCVPCLSDKQIHRHVPGHTRQQSSIASHLCPIHSQSAVRDSQSTRTATQQRRATQLLLLCTLSRRRSVVLQSSGRALLVLRWSSSNLCVRPCLLCTRVCLPFTLLPSALTAGRVQGTLLCATAGSRLQIDAGG